jgi:protein-S-isoprenylcysteine O-methyltransferase Ste14
MVVDKVSKKRTGLGVEHPWCDSIQLLMLMLFFVILGIDSFSFFVFEYSTIFAGLTLLPLRLFLAVATIAVCGYLLAKSHRAIFGKKNDQLRLVDSGVYGWVRHPMYLGTLMFCLAFLCVMPSLVALGVWLAFFIFFDRMATYEEKALIQILGEEYLVYQKRVPKWFPRPFRRRDET